MKTKSVVACLLIATTIALVSCAEEPSAPIPSISNSDVPLQENDNSSNPESITTADSSYGEPTIQSEINSLNVAIEFHDRQYNEVNVIEIPTFVGDSEVVATLNNTITSTTDAFIASVPEGGGMEITTSPTSTYYYIQSVTRMAVNGSEDTAGELLTVTYDIANDKIITLDDALALHNTTADAVLDGAKALHETEIGSAVVDAELMGFIIIETPTGDSYWFYLKMTVPGTNGDLRTNIYRYVLDPNVIEVLDLQQIVDPFIVDTHEPMLIANRIASEMMS